MNGLRSHQPHYATYLPARGVTPAVEDSPACEIKRVRLGQPQASSGWNLTTLPQALRRRRLEGPTWVTAGGIFLILSETIAAFLGHVPYQAIDAVLPTPTDPRPGGRGSAPILRIEPPDPCRRRRWTSDTLHYRGDAFQTLACASIGRRPGANALNGNTTSVISGGTAARPMSATIKGQRHDRRLRVLVWTAGSVKAQRHAISMGVVEPTPSRPRPPRQNGTPGKSPLTWRRHRQQAAVSPCQPRLLDPAAAGSLGVRFSWTSDWLR